MTAIGNDNVKKVTKFTLINTGFKNPLSPLNANRRPTNGELKARINKIYPIKPVSLK